MTRTGGQWDKPGSTRLAGEDSELLAEGQILEDKTLPGGKGGAKGRGAEGR